MGEADLCEQAIDPVNGASSSNLAVGDLKVNGAYTLTGGQLTSELTFESMAV
jgi:hypothetical protein